MTEKEIVARIDALVAKRDANEKENRAIQEEIDGLYDLLEGSEEE